MITKGGTAPSTRLLVRRMAALISSASVTMLLSMPSAGADAIAGPNNCLGAAFSGLVPEETSAAPPAYGETTAAQAQAGVRDDLLTAATHALASCGSPQ